MKEYYYTYTVECQDQKFIGVEVKRKILNNVTGPCTITLIKEFEKFNDAMKSILPDVVSGSAVLLPTKAVVCIETKEIFINSLAACKKYEVSRSNMSKTLNHQNRYSLKGLKFVYLTEFLEGSYE